MEKTTIFPRRERLLNDRPPRAGAYVLYWMQRAQRTGHNHALEAAVAKANELSLPVLVAFGLTDDYPEANLRHYRFMAEGLRDVATELRDRGIAFVVRRGEPPAVAAELAGSAAFVVCDAAYLRHLRRWRGEVAGATAATVVEIETDICVPVEVTSDKREYAARTIRKKVMGRLDDFLDAPQPVRPTRPVSEIPSTVFTEAVDPSDPAALCDMLELDRSVSPVPWFLEGGEHAARDRFAAFLADRAHLYAENRNEPATSDTSYMSPYLHFGHVSPLHLVLRMREAAQQDGGIRESLESFVEELVVRRELAQNYVFFESRYDRYEALPEWARTTLAEHASDTRPALYSTAELERAETHDEYWNAAMREMVATGYMHNYMRMYWGKKILEWTEDPAEAFRRTLYLNNRYFLDGRDPASFANVAWVFGLHDRAWPQREVFGKVRTMKASGLERKCDMAGYLEKVKGLEARGREY
jgi:deoxyribodipyrimidine photo-lyase